MVDWLERPSPNVKLSLAGPEQISGQARTTPPDGPHLQLDLWRTRRHTTRLIRSIHESNKRCGRPMDAGQWLGAGPESERTPVRRRRRSPPKLARVAVAVAVGLDGCIARR